jgi:hypothetical protein
MIKKALYVSAGLLAVALGFLGVFLPLLPTTPLLLLAAACFLKSSDRLYYWITHHKIFGRYIVSYQKYKAITKQAKIYTIMLLWVTIGTTAIFFVEFLWLRIMLFVIAVSVTIHVLKLKTLNAEIIERYEKESENFACLKSTK